MVARDPSELDELLDEARRPLLLDTAGRSPNDSASRDMLRVLTGRTDVRTHLVLAASTPVDVARRIFDRFEDAQPSRVVLTKLDEAESLAALLPVLRERELPISYLCTGQNVPEDMERATAACYLRLGVGRGIGEIRAGQEELHVRMMTAAVAADPGMNPRDQLVMQHVPLVKTLAQRLAQRLPSQVEVNDLISVGVIGLIDAASRYKPTLGVPFDAFARRRVQGAMLDSLRDLDWAPRSLRRLRRDVDSAIGSLRRKLGREPEEKEIADEMSLSMADYEKSMEQLRTLDVGTVRSLDAPTEDGSTRLEMLRRPRRGRRAAPRAPGAARST